MGLVWGLSFRGSSELPHSGEFQRVWGVGFRVSGFWFRVSGFGFWV